MQHMNSGQVPATVIFTALLVIILVSSGRTTYKLAPPPASDAALAHDAGYALASCDSRPVASAPEPEPRPVASTPGLEPHTFRMAREGEPPRICAWPRRFQHSSVHSRGQEGAPVRHSVAEASARRPDTLLPPE